MAKIVDPDQLNQGTEVVIDAGNKTVQLVVAGNLDDTSPGKSSGVTLQAVYSFLKEEWLADAALNKLRFPLLAIFEAKFELQNGWTWADQQTRDLIRDAGFREVDTDEWACIISLGDMDAPLADQAYYQQVSGFDQTTTNFDKTGELNENIRIFEDSGPSNFRGFLKAFLREQAKLYDEGNLLVDQDLSVLTYQAYRMPLSNGPDLKVTTSDGDIDTLAPYTGMKIAYLKGNTFETWADSTVFPAGAVVLDPIRQSGGSSNGTWWFTPAGGTTSGTGTADDTGITDWESYAGERQIGTEWFAFNRIAEGNGGDAEQIYEFLQRQLRKTTDINADDVGGPNQNGFGVVNGNVAVLLSEFIGDTLRTNPGVYIDGFDVNDQNRIEFQDVTVDGGGLDSESVPLTTTIRTFPFVAAGSIIFSQNLLDEADVDTLYRMYFDRTQRITGTDIEMASASGDTGTLQTTTTDLTGFVSGEYLFISGFTNSGNNGMFRATGNGTATSLAVERVDNATTVVNEAAGNTVNLDEDPFDSPDAVIVDDNGGTDITGQITQGTIAFDFDYDGNTQGGRAAGTDAPIVIVAQGLAGATWVEAAGTITRATGQTFRVNALDERNYSNPA